MDITREAIVPSLGATRYTVGPDRLDSQSQGEDAPFNQTMLRFPGVAQDSFAQLHVRGEHANFANTASTTCSCRKVIPGFGLELETRFADSVSLITGALPAQVRISHEPALSTSTRRTAPFSNRAKHRSTVESFDTIMPSFEYGGVTGKLNYYLPRITCMTASGSENPTRTANPIHDDTDQLQNVWIFFLHSRRHQPIGVAHQRQTTAISKFRNNPGQRQSSPTWADRHSIPPSSMRPRSSKCIRHSHLSKED